MKAKENQEIDRRSFIACKHHKCHNLSCWVPVVVLFDCVFSNAGGYVFRHLLSRMHEKAKRSFLNVLTQIVSTYRHLNCRFIFRSAENWSWFFQTWFASTIRSVMIQTTAAMKSAEILLAVGATVEITIYS